MILSLDTNVFVELIRGKTPIVRRRFVEALFGGQSLVGSLIVQHELLYGAELHPHRQAQQQSVRKVLADVTIEPFDERDVAVAAAIRAQLKRRGLPIGYYDLLIAGQALARGWMLVTANTREFNRIEGLNVIDWTLAAD